MSPDGTFRRVLAVAAGDPAQDRETLTLAARIAAAHGAELATLEVVGAPARQLAGLGGGDSAAIAARLLADRRAALERLVRMAVPDRPAAVEVRAGKAFLETVRHVLAGGHDLVVKTAEELDGRARHLLASTDQHLLRKCPATVWLRRTAAAPRPRCVLAAVDVDYEASEEPETEAALNRRIVAQAQAIAAWAGAPLHLLSVWDAPDEGLLRAWAPAEAGRSYLDQLESRQWARLGTLAQAAAQSGPPPARHHVERGRPRAAIPETVRRLGVDLLVLGTVARTGIPGLIIGNTAEDVLNSVEVPLVAVKPPGYTSPIRP